MIQNKKDYLFEFIEMVDIVLYIVYMCVFLKEVGYFQYVKFEQKKKNVVLKDFLEELKFKYDEWCKVLCECCR